MNIIVAVDDSPRAQAVLDFAQGVGKRLNPQRQHRIILYRSAGRRGDVEEITAQLQTLAGSLEDEGRTASVHVDQASPAQGIADLARKNDAALIIIGGRRLHPALGLFLGSVGQRLVQIAPCPVLIARTEAASVWPTDGPLSIVLGFAGAETGARGVDFVRRFAGRTLAPADPPHQVTVVHALETASGMPPELAGGRAKARDQQAWLYESHAGPRPSGTTSPVSDDEEVRRIWRERGERLVDIAARRLAEPGLRVEKVVKEGPPAQILAEAAASQQAALLVVGVHGLTAPSGVMGSVTFRLLQTSPTSLLIIPAENEGSA